MSNESVLLGQYVHGKSVLHRLDARAKIVSVFIFALAVFGVGSWLSLLISTIYLFSLMVLSKLSIPMLLRSLKVVALFLLLFFLLQVLAVREGEVAFSIAGFPLYMEGIIEAGVVVWRTMLLFMAATLMTATTSPLHITSAVESLLKPLKRLRVPVAELALMMSIALRFIPILKRELDLIRRAQQARGVSSEGFTKRLYAFSALLVPLFVRSLKRAEELAEAMEARGYDSKVPRSVWKKSKWSLKDTFAVALALGTAGLIIWF